MCGLTGINEKNEAAITNAALCFKYRGPNAFGIYSDEHITLGHNRLSIIDLDTRANQPFFDESKRCGVVFNGEIYNFLELRDELMKSGKYNFRTESDTEVLVYAYMEWGVEFVQRLRGMFALAIYDKKSEQLILASDISAIKPMYYAHVDGIFAFSSEVNGLLSLLRNKGITPQIDGKNIELYFAFGYVPAPLTLFKEIKRMPSSTLLMYDLKNKKLDEIFYGVNEKGRGIIGLEKLREIIRGSVQAHLVADVPVGVFFSGGTDSSLITAMLHELGVNLETFSVAISGRGGDEAYFNSIAKELNIKSHVIRFDQNMFNETYKEVLEKLDEPIASNSLLPIYAVSKSAASRVKVVLSGEGGDEFFYGYPRQLVLNSPSTRDDKLNWADMLYIYTPQFHGKNRLFEMIFSLLSKKVSYYLLTMSPSRDLLKGSSWISAHRELREKRLSPRRYDEELYLPNDLLRKLDLMTMHNSIEGRVPLVDREVISASRKILTHEASQELKPTLKAILAQYISPNFVYRKKSGFGLHLPVFFENSLYIKADLEEAIIILKKEKMLPLKHLPAVPVLISKYPNLAWAIIVLFRVLKNNAILR